MAVGLQEAFVITVYDTRLTSDAKHLGLMLVAGAYMQSDSQRERSVRKQDLEYRAATMIIPRTQIRLGAYE